MSKPPKWIRKGFVEIILPPDGQFPAELLALRGTATLGFRDSHGMHLIYRYDRRLRALASRARPFGEQGPAVVSRRGKAAMLHAELNWPDQLQEVQITHGR
jgi:hypothetical protein